GLQTAEQLRADTLQRERDRRTRLANLDPVQSGQQAATVYRSRTGRVQDPAELASEARAKQARETARQQQQKEWNRGVVQNRERRAAAQRFTEESQLPLARYKDDQAYNAELRDQSRWNDPAAAFMAKKGKQKTRRPVYEGPPGLSNRFNIKPGFRWDGVDRSNGFEKEYFLRQNSRIASAAKDYAYSTED
ncbi:Pre-mRNA-splicing factor of RES complex-domain-containing protein, partial [Dimargaris cristalligena]